MRYIVQLFFLTIISFTAFSQTGKVEGKITDSKTGKALTGVSVTVSGNNKGVATDIDGRYVLTIQASKSLSITVSSVGYQTKEISNVEVAPNALINLDVVMESATKTEAEIVI